MPLCAWHTMAFWCAMHKELHGTPGKGLFTHLWHTMHTQAPRRWSTSSEVGLQPNSPVQ